MRTDGEGSAGGTAGAARARLRLEPATPDDATELLALRDGLGRWLADRGIRQWEPGEFPHERLVAWLTAGSVHVLRREGRIVAAVAVLWDDPEIWGDDPAPAGYVHLLMVDRSQAGQGVGDAMLAWAEAHIAAHGRRRARLDAGRDNHRLQSWYAARGYREVGEREFEDDHWFAVTLREKTLPDVTAHRGV